MFAVDLQHRISILMKKTTWLLPLLLACGVAVHARPSFSDTSQPRPGGDRLIDSLSEGDFPVCSAAALPIEKTKKMSNKEILMTANQAIHQGDYEGFLAYCTEDTKWVYVGEQTITGKDQLRHYLPTAYEGATFTTEQYIEQGEYLTVLGKIQLKQKDGNLVRYTYCDVWHFREGKLAELKAFVIAD